MIPALATQTVSPFPNPPHYSQLYTNENVEQNTALLPPAPQTEFRVFGEEYKIDADVIAPLSDSGIRVLYSNKNDWKNEMKKLNRSVVAAFMDLVEILVRCPDNPARDEKMNDIHTILINMHHLINEYRPVQARDTLRLLQKQQLEELEATVDAFKTYLDAGREALMDQFDLSNVRLEPPPKPKPITRVRLEDDAMGIVEDKFVVKKEEVKQEEDNDESVDVQNARPSTAHLRARHIYELQNLTLND